MKKETKIIIRFIVVIVLSSLAGFAASMLFAFFGDHAAEGISSIAELFAPVVPALFVILNIVFSIWSFVILSKQKKKLVSWDEEDEIVADEIEKDINFALIFANGMMVVNFFLFGATIYAIEKTHFGENHPFVLFLVGLAFFIYSMVWETSVSKKAVDLVKEMNPEKKGNILDFKFQKEWLNSCDEAEKARTYECGFRAYKAGSLVCPILWLVCMFSELWLDSGLLPLFCVTAIWFTMVMTASVTDLKLSSNRKAGNRE